MKVLSITERNLKKLPRLQISNRVVSTEGKLYIYDYKDKWKHLREVLKIYYNQSDAYLADKIYTISQLLASFDQLDVPELVLPTALLSVNGNISGYSMPLVENNVNLTLILNNPKVNLELKMKLLKEIYSLLSKITSIRELDNKFFLGDIHEANFILDVDEQMVKAVDLDSSYINGSSISISKFLTFNHNLLNNPLKYPHDDEDRAIPNQNTTILCFCYMLLNVLSGNTDSHLWSPNEFYSYIEFMKKNGCSEELAKALINLYSKSQTNDFSEELLDSIDTRKDFTLKRAHIPTSNNHAYYS